MKKHVILCDSMNWFPNLMRKFMIFIPYRLSDIEDYLQEKRLSNSNVSTKCDLIFREEIKEHLNNDKLKFFLLVFPPSYRTSSSCDKRYIKAFNNVLKEINSHDIELLDISEIDNPDVEKYVSKEKIIRMTPNNNDVIAFSKKFHAYLDANNLYEQYC